MVLIFFYFAVFRIYLCILTGRNKTILWGEVDKVGNELFWCEGGFKLPSEAVISGNTDKLFFLLSLEESMPNLHAVPLNNSLGINIRQSNCLYNQSIFEQCNNGNRSKELSFYDKIVKKYGLEKQTEY
jgi:hypothetical protein